MAEHGVEDEMAGYYSWRPSLNPTQIQVFHQEEPNIADQNTARTTTEIDGDFNHSCNYYCYYYYFYHYSNY